VSTIRLIEEGELSGLLLLYGHLHSHDEPLGTEVAKRIWHELQSSSRHQYVGAFVGTRMVATCALTVIPNLTRGGSPYGVIENVVTDPAHRRQGHGRLVLRKALSLAWFQGCYKVMLATGRRDAAVSRFYESAGFSPHEKQSFVARPGD
jgi:GNAT superfamily N-acetyltransferase